MSARFAMAAHVLGLLAAQEQRGGGPSSSTLLARSVNTNPVVVRRLLADLKAAGLVRIRRGAGGGTVLARDPESLSLREVYEAVAEERTLLRCAPCTDGTACDMGQHAQDWLTDVFAEAEEALLARLARHDIGELRDALLGANRDEWTHSAPIR